MITLTDVGTAVAISLIYLLTLPFQLILFPMKYYSVKDVIFCRNVKKATGAFLTRFVFILLICWISWVIGIRNHIVIWGITIGSFLCTWPSIYHYQLFIIWKNRYKALYFLACIVSIFFSWACAVIATKVLLPMIYENKGFYLIDNNGIRTLFTIFGLVCPIGIRQIIKEDEQDNPYLISDTFFADLYLTTRKIQFDKAYFDQYGCEISDAAEKNSIPYELLRVVLQLEKIHRGSWYHRVSEYLAVRIIPRLLIHLNATLGLAQISIRTAQGYFHMAPYRYIREMIKTEVSIELCAFVIKNMPDEYESYSPSDVDPFFDLYENDGVTDDYKRSLYIASNYICGENNVLKKYILVYAQIIDENTPAIYSANG